MFEARSDTDRWYIVHTPDGHLAHIERDGHQVAAFFTTEDEAKRYTRLLNQERYGPKEEGR